MTDIEKIHKIDLEIVKEVINLCEKHGLTYYMLGGTMLGAVRHGGFIPWDDDIDLGMFRDDYEAFLIYAEELPKHLKVVNYRNSPSYQYYITRVLDTKTKVVEERIGNDNKYTNASIDIFPIDGTPNNKFLRKIHYTRILYHRALMSLCYKDSIDRKRPRSSAEKALLWVLEKLPIEKMTSAYKQKDKIDKLLRKQKVDGSEYIGNIMGAYRTREIVPYKYYGKGKFYDFEDIKLRGMELADEYLTHTYGDYMQLPPEELRKTHFKIIDIQDSSI